jgi:hypothetical protein
MKFNPNQTEIRAKKSSLAIQINKDDEFEFSFFVYNKRTGSIISFYKIPLLQHCRDSMQNVSPIPKGKRK